MEEKMNRRRFGTLLLCFATSLLLCSCAVRTNSAGQKVKGTPQEQALAYNATIASANGTLAQTVINATATTPPLLDVATANRILTAQSKVADADRQLTPLLADAANLSKNAATIQKLLGDIQEAAQPLVSGGDLGIKDAKTQAAVSTALQTIITGASQVLQTLTAAGLLK